MVARRRHWPAMEEIAATAGVAADTLRRHGALLRSPDRGTRRHSRRWTAAVACRGAGGCLPRTAPLVPACETRRRSIRRLRDTAGARMTRSGSHAHGRCGEPAAACARRRGRPTPPFPPPWRFTAILLDPPRDELRGAIASRLRRQCWNGGALAEVAAAAGEMRLDPGASGDAGARRARTRGAPWPAPSTLADEARTARGACDRAATPSGKRTWFRGHRTLTDPCTNAYDPCANRRG